MNECKGLDLYRSLFVCRRTEEYLVQLYPEDEMRTPMHMSMGQEAVPVGICTALKAEDRIFSSYRSHAPFLAKTMDIEGFFSEFYGKASGVGQGKSGSLHLSDPERGHMCSSGIVAAPIPLALGAAYAEKIAGQGGVACVFFGDGATDEGVFWESINFASLMRLPVLFVCEDNGFSVLTATQYRQGFRSLAEVVGGFDIQVFDEETNDVEEVYGVAQTAINAVHKNGAPAFLRFRCFRYLEHVGIGDDVPLGYRSGEELAWWKERDTVKLQRKRLCEQGLGDEVIVLEEEVEARIVEAISNAKVAPYPTGDQLRRGVFHEAD